MIKLGILSFSDGRKRVHDSLVPYIKECEERIKVQLELTDEYEIITGDEIIWNAELAREQAKKMNSYFVDGIILNVPVFAFPNLVLITATVADGPYLAIAPVNGELPGLGGLLAATNLLKENGIQHEKIWGNVEQPEVFKKLVSFGRAAYAVSSLKGQVYGVIGGRSIGMGTGAANPDLILKVFGVDVDHMDQLEIIRRAKLIDQQKVDNAFEWLNKRVGKIHYDNDKLTEDSLKMQIQCYYATKEIIEDRKWSFVGVKCHYDMSEYYVAQCLAAAFMNDPYDWDGAKTPVIYSCEADTDGALTMQMMKLVSNQPVLFADFRHFDDEDGVFVFCNCGASASWYANRSDNPEENLKEVSLYPLIPKYGGKGCHVQYISREGEMTLGRLTHSGDKYKMLIFKGECKKFPPEKLEQTCPNWPHSFIKVDTDPYKLIEKYESNHVHAIYGDYIDELIKTCELLDIEYEVIR
ncbi:MAG: L-fucose/L-arabinose isomerase family protein [Clostridia bacterium]